MFPVARSRTPGSCRACFRQRWGRAGSRKPLPHPAKNRKNPIWKTGSWCCIRLPTRLQPHPRLGLNRIPAHPCLLRDGSFRDSLNSIPRLPSAITLARRAGELWPGCNSTPSPMPRAQSRSTSLRQPGQEKDSRAISPPSGCVYTWGAARMQYETSYVENNLCGRLPLEASQTPAGPEFRFSDEKNAEHAYRLVQTVVRRIPPPGAGRHSNQRNSPR